jgi:hypothetical protein
MSRIVNVLSRIYPQRVLIYVPHNSRSQLLHIRYTIIEKNGNHVANLYMFFTQYLIFCLKCVGHKFKSITMCDYN